MNTVGIALRVVAFIDCLCAVWAAWAWMRLSAWTPQSSPDAGIASVYALALIVIGVVGVASGASLMWLSRTSKPEGILIIPGLIAPALLVLFALG